jgi:uncharacterized protein YeaO (DUF488 family)
MAIRLKRVDEPPDPDDGKRYLLERLWPRAIRQADLQLTAWLRDVAPSHELRRWYGHDPTKWPAFQARYLEELQSNPAAWEPLLGVHSGERSRSCTVRATRSATTRSSCAPSWRSSFHSANGGMRSAPLRAASCSARRGSRTSGPAAESRTRTCSARSIRSSRSPSSASVQGIVSIGTA